MKTPKNIVTESAVVKTQPDRIINGPKANQKLFLNDLPYETFGLIHP